MDVVRNVFVACVLVLSAVLVPSVLSEGTSTSPEVVQERYSVSIIDAYAVIDIERVLYNPGKEPLDHTFVFTIPKDALISEFSIVVNGVTYYADVMEKEEAEEKYEQAVSEGRNAGLVASLGDQIFAYKVSLKASEEMTATIRYEQVLLKANGWHTLYLPVVSGSEPYEVGDFEVDITIESPSKIDSIETSGYNDTLSTTKVNVDKARVSMYEKDFTADEDIEVRWCTIGGASEGKMYFGEHDGMGYFVHVFDPDPVEFGDERMPKDFIFVLDKSGSMIGTKFHQAQMALDHIYGSLMRDDRFSFVLFNGGSSIYSDELLRANGDNVFEVRDYIDGLEASGSTNIHAGIVDSLDIFKKAGDTVPVVVLLTDGKANTGLYHRSEFRQDVQAKNTVGASIYCIALGNGADWTFCEALALENKGRAIWVLENEDVVTEINDFVRSFSSPLLAQLTFDYGPDVIDVHPSQVPAHFEGSEVLVTGRFPIDADDVPMSLSAISPEGNFLVEAEFPTDDRSGGDFVPRFWAYQRIKELEDQMKYDGPDNDTIDEITQLGIEFHFATEYTSLFVDLPQEILEQFYREKTENVYLDQSGEYLPRGNNAPAPYDSMAYSAPPKSPSSADSELGGSALSVSYMPIVIGIFLLLLVVVALAVFAWRRLRRPPHNP